MGLFSKKTLICPSCGKEFVSRYNLPCCMECFSRFNDKEKRVNGYLQYAEDMLFGNSEQKKRLTNILSVEQEAETEPLISHQDEILNRRNPEYALTDEKMDWIDQNFNSMTEAEAINFINCIAQSCVRTTKGCSINRYFMFPNKYNCAFVSPDDVCAIAYDMNFAGGGTYYFFTRDPFVPAIPMRTMVNSFFFLSKVKRNEHIDIFNELFQDYCPNLIAPIRNVKEFQQDTKEGKYLDQVADIPTFSNKAFSYVGAFKNKNSDLCEITDKTTEVLNRYGYRTGEQIYQIFQAKCEYNRKLAKFWNAQFETYLCMLDGFEQEFFAFIMGGIHAPVEDKK